MCGSRPLPGLSLIFARCLPTGKAVAPLLSCWMLNLLTARHKCAHWCPWLFSASSLQRSKKMVREEKGGHYRHEPFFVPLSSIATSGSQEEAGCTPSQWLHVEFGNFNLPWRWRTLSTALDQYQPFPAKPLIALFEQHIPDADEPWSKARPAGWFGIFIGILVVFPLTWRGT